MFLQIFWNQVKVKLSIVSLGSLDLILISKQLVLEALSNFNRQKCSQHIYLNKLFGILAHD